MSTTTRDIIRRCRFTPYRKGCGPTFSLIVWDCHRPHNGGPQWQLGYRLTMIGVKGKRTVLFEAEDYGCSPMDAIDSDRSIAGLMGWLTLRPGDTDREYFESYSATQFQFCDHHAEALSCEVENRFGAR